MVSLRLAKIVCIISGFFQTCYSERIDEILAGFSSNFQHRNSPLLPSRNGKIFPNPKVRRCGEVGSELVVNFVNQRYPDDDFSVGDCNFRLLIHSHDICQVRVDLVDTEFLKPTRGECLSQAFTIEGSIWPTGLAPICGANNDQHFYLHLEPWAANKSLIDFKVHSIVKGKAYRFGIWVTQIDCAASNVLKAPQGCTQYFLSESGNIKSFNFEGSRYLNGQNYQICIRPGRGVCGTRFDSQEFRVKKSTNGPKEIMLRSGVGAAVCRDYLMIPDGQETIASLREKRLLFRRRPPPQKPPVAIKVNKRKFEIPTSQDRYCGGHLNPAGGEIISRPVFARVRSNLIALRFKSSPLQEFNRRLEGLNLTMGFLIKYTQLRMCEDEEADIVVPPPLATQLYNNQVPLNRDPLDTSASFTLVRNGTQVDRDDLEDDDSVWDYLEEDDPEDADDGDYYFD